jgi:hypothetical protein
MSYSVAAEAKLAMWPPRPRMEPDHGAAIRYLSRLGFPGVAIDDLEARRQAAARIPRPGTQQPAPCAPVLAAQQCIAHAEVSLVGEEGARRSVGQGDHFHVHHRIAESGRDQHVAQIVHVEETPRRIAGADFLCRRTQLFQRVGAERGETQESTDFQHAMQFAQRRQRIVQPVQHQVGPDQAQAVGGQRQGAHIGIDQARAAPGQALQARRAATHGTQHGQGVIEGERQGLAVAPLQLADAVAGGAADIGYARRRDFHQVESRPHAGADFAGKGGSRVVGIRSPGKVTTHGEVNLKHTTQRA